MGYVPLALAGYPLWSKRQIEAFWSANGLIFFVLSLGPYLHVAGRETPIPLPYLALYHFLPLFRIARGVSRFDVMVMLSLALLAALGLQRLVASLPEARRRILALAAIALVCFEFLPLPYPVADVKIPTPFHWWKGLPFCSTSVSCVQISSRRIQVRSPLKFSSIWESGM